MTGLDGYEDCEGVFSVVGYAQNSQKYCHKCVPKVKKAQARKNHYQRMSDPEAREQKNKKNRENMREQMKDPQVREHKNERQRESEKRVLPGTIQRLLREQDGKCAICGCTEEECRIQTRDGRRFHLDHCHETGKARGLLCHNCNVKLVSKHSTPKILQAAIRYLEKHA